MRSPVTLVIQSFNALTEDEKKLCLDFIAPEPEPQLEVSAKKTRKKRAARSTHAESLSAAIAKTPKADADATPCTYQYPKDGSVNPGMVCGQAADNAVHDETFGYADYHPFESTAPTATRRSSRKGAGTNSTPNSETSSEGALAVGAGGD